MNNPCVSLTIPAKAEYLHIVKLTLYGIANHAGFSYEEIEDMKVAVAEACNNAVLHAFNDMTQGLVEIHFELSENEMNIRIKDEGSSFDYEHIANKSTSLHNKSLSEASVGGLGIFMMQALMDKVQVFTNGGTEVILTKILARKEGM